MTDNTQLPTQSQHPWKATLRTMIALAVAAAAFLPQIVDASGVDQAGWIGALLAGSAIVTRVMAIPFVNDLLTKVGLGATPKTGAPPR